MSILYDASEEYSKERAIKLQDQGNTKEALKILTKIYQKEKPGTHGFAMMSMGLSRAYRLVGEHELEEKYLILAAMTDINWQ